MRHRFLREMTTHFARHLRGRKLLEEGRESGQASWATGWAGESLGTSDAGRRSASGQLSRQRARWSPVLQPLQFGFPDDV